MFSLEEYTHFKPVQAFFLMGCFITTVLGLCGVVHMYYPDKPSAPREFPDGLDKELGGPTALLVGPKRCDVKYLAQHADFIRIGKKIWG